jgi:putative cell wall-binding protein
MTRQSKKPAAKKWSQRVTRESHALALDEGMFTWKDPKKIARSLKRSADSSVQRKASPFQSAMSMLVFYMNRAGSKLDEEQKRILERAKTELRKLYHKD